MTISVVSALGLDTRPAMAAASVSRMILGSAHGLPDESSQGWAAFSFSLLGKV